MERESEQKTDSVVEYLHEKLDQVALSVDIVVPQIAGNIPAQPKKKWIIFVLDNSGSMSGSAIEYVCS
jgi:hypothetical protein